MSLSTVILKTKDEKLMTKKSPLILFLAFILMTTLISCTPSRSSLSVEEFKNPAKVYRPLALWTWMNGYVDTGKLVYELKEMKEKGMRGALIWDIGSLADPEKIIPEGPAFLGPQSLEYVSLALKTAGELGLDLGMVASSSWNAGGEWITEKDASKQILCTRQIVTGPAKRTLSISVPETRRGSVKIFSLITSMALPHSGSKTIEQGFDRAIRLDELTRDRNTIEWDVPAGDWEVFSFFSCNTGQNLVCPSPNSNGLVIDHLSRIATQNHFDSMLTRLSSISSPGNHLKIFMLDSYEVRRMKDWSPGFIEEFTRRYRYDPVPYLPLLLGYQYKDSVVAERFRGDYSRLVSDLMIENHFGQSVEIADKHGIQMLTEAGHGGSPRVDPLKALGHSHIPMGEFWNRRKNWVTKEAASAAHIYGLNLVAAESLTGWNHWQHGPADFKQLIDIAFCAGLNQVVFHTFAHNPEIAGRPGFTYHAGEHINVNTTWWPMARPFMDYIGRCSYMLRQGLFVADACLYYGDQAPNLVPPRRIGPNIKPRWDNTKCLHCGQPKPVDPGPLPGYDYDYMNAEIITTSLRVENGRLRLPCGQSYRLLLLPDQDAISLEVLQSLEKLVSDGAVIIGRKPTRTTSLENYPGCDAEVSTITEKLWGNCDGRNTLSNPYGKGIVYWRKTVKEVLGELGVAPDFEVQGIDNRDQHIDYIHRQTPEEDIYFVSNSHETSESFRVIFRVDPKRNPEIWDPQSGLIQREVKYSVVEGGIQMELAMDPLDSRFVVFTDHTTGENDSGLWHNLQFANKSNPIDQNPPEGIDLTTNWRVSFDPSMGGPATFNLNKLQSWSEIKDEAIQYYSGKALYSKNFSVEKSALAKGRQAVLQFDNIQEMARVKINGEDCGILWTPPYQIDITDHIRTGENEILIEVINTWNNRIVGDVRNPDQRQYTKTNIKNKFRRGNLLESGLMGKAEILFRE